MKTTVGFDWSGDLVDLYYVVKRGGYLFHVKKGFRAHDDIIIESRSNMIFIEDGAGYYEDVVEIMKLLSDIVWCYRIVVFDYQFGGGCGVNSRCISPLCYKESVDLTRYVPFFGNEEQNLALAYYRDGMSSNSVFLAFLSFFKILEIKMKGKERERWLASYLSNKQIHSFNIPTYMPNDPSDLSSYIYNECRNPIAHGRYPSLAYPDSVRDYGKISDANMIMRSVAEYYIQTELGVDPLDGRTSGENMCVEKMDV